MSHRARLATLIALNDYPMRNLVHKTLGNNELPVELSERADDIPTHVGNSN